MCGAMYCAPTPLFTQQEVIGCVVERRRSFCALRRTDDLVAVHSHQGTTTDIAHSHALRNFALRERHVIECALSADRARGLFKNDRHRDPELRSLRLKRTQVRRQQSTELELQPIQLRTQHSVHSALLIRRTEVGAGRRNIAAD